MPLVTRNPSKPPPNPEDNRHIEDIQFTLSLRCSEHATWLERRFRIHSRDIEALIGNLEQITLTPFHNDNRKLAIDLFLRCYQTVRVRLHRLNCEQIVTCAGAEETLSQIAKSFDKLQKRYLKSFT